MVNSTIATSTQQPEIVISSDYPCGNSTMVRRSTGFAELDDTLCGGIPKSCFVCVSGESISYMSSFTFQITTNLLKSGLRGLYVCLDRTAEETRRYFEELGLNIYSYTKDYSIFFLDFFTQSQDALIESAELTSLAYKPNDSLKAIGQFLDWIKDGFLVIDTFSTFTLNLDSSRAYEFVRALKLLARTFNLTIIAINYTAPMDTKTISMLHSVSDGNLIFEKDILHVESFLGVSQNSGMLMITKSTEGTLSLRHLLPAGLNNETMQNIQNVFTKSSSLTINPLLSLGTTENISIPINQLNESLAKLKMSGIVDAQPYCSSLSCPQCESKEIKVNLSCPDCKAILLSKGDTLEHFSCGHVTFRHNFEHNGKLVCPKCSKELRQIGVDYKQVGSWYKCNAGHTFPNTLLLLTCVKCNHTFDLDDAKLQTQYKYELTNKGKQSLNI